MDNHRVRPREQGRDHDAGSLAAACRRKNKHVRLSAISQKPDPPEVQPSREEDTRFALTWTDQAQPHSQTPKAPPDPRLRFEKLSPLYVPCGRPPGRPVKVCRCLEPSLARHSHRYNHEQRERRHRIKDLANAKNP